MEGRCQHKGGAKISWDSICLPYEEGGLGFKNLKEWNQAQTVIHLCRVVSKSSALWPQWINKTLLKKQHFWIMKMPNDCSWTFRNILRLRMLTRQFLSYKIGNGLATSLWFDPWWHGTCLAENTQDRIITQAGISSAASVHSLLTSGSWILPRPSPRLHHIHPLLAHWTEHFDYPTFDLTIPDVLLWDDIPLRKIKARNVWTSIRTHAPQVPWSHLVWNRLRIQRYAHLEWILCHGRLPTFTRLASFGLQVLSSCTLCPGGIETEAHLFLLCPYSNFILAKLAGLINFNIVGSTWKEFLISLGNISDQTLRSIALLTAQIFTYHLWRERNARLHDRGVSGPKGIIHTIMVDLKTKLLNTDWFIKHANLDSYGWLLI